MGVYDLVSGELASADVDKSSYRCFRFWYETGRASFGQRRFSYRQCNPAFFDIEENDGCDLAKRICRRGFRLASSWRGIGRLGCRAQKCLEQLFRVFDDMGVFVVFAKAGMAAIRGDCDSFRGGIAFQVDAGDAAVCFDSAGLLADGQVRRTEGVAMALAGDCR